MILIYVYLLFNRNVIEAELQRTAYNDALHIENVSNNISTSLNRVIKDFENDRNIPDYVHECNSSFPIPADYITDFNTSASLPKRADPSAMCFFRCYYENSGFIENWKLNATKIREYMWPATGDSIEVCEKEQVKELNACIRAFAIFKCLTLRALVDANYKT